VDKSQSVHNGYNADSGSPQPIWLKRNWEFREAYEVQYSLWTVQ